MKQKNKRIFIGCQGPLPDNFPLTISPGCQGPIPDRVKGMVLDDPE